MHTHHPPTILERNDHAAGSHAHAITFLSHPIPHLHASESLPRVCFAEFIDWTCDLPIDI